MSHFCYFFNYKWFSRATTVRYEINVFEGLQDA